MEKLKTVQRFPDLIYDVGMNIGEDTEFYLKKGFRVIAFEANSELVKQNQERFRKEIANNQLTIVEGAIVEDASSDTIKFYKNLDNSKWSTIDSNWTQRCEKLGTRNKIIEVNTIDYSKCIEKYGIPYYMKIDIEGAERICLKHLLRFNVRPCYLSIESEKVSFDKLCYEISLLEELGYHHFMAVQQARIPLIRVPDPAKEGKYVAHKFAKGSSGLFGKELDENWKSKEDILKEYRVIFHQYDRYGDDTFWQKNKYANIFLRMVSFISNRPVPGWYDTHAKHSCLF